MVQKLTRETLTWWSLESLMDEILSLQDRLEKSEESNSEKDKTIERQARELTELEERMDVLRKRIASGRKDGGGYGDIFTDFADLFGRAPR